MAPLAVCSAWGAAVPQSMTLQMNTHRVEKDATPTELQQQQQHRNQYPQVDKPTAPRRQEQQHNTDDYGCSNSSSVFNSCQHATRASQQQREVNEQRQEKRRRQRPPLATPANNNTTQRKGRRRNNARGRRDGDAPIALDWNTWTGTSGSAVDLVQNEKRTDKNKDFAEPIQ